jgi:hypothetical protein
MAYARGDGKPAERGTDRAIRWASAMEKLELHLEQNPPTVRLLTADEADSSD